MRWKIGLHFYWWRPAKWKKNNSQRVGEEEKKISGGMIVGGRPSKLVSCDSDKGEPAVCHAGDDVVLEPEGSFIHLSSVICTAEVLTHGWSLLKNIRNKHKRIVVENVSFSFKLHIQRRIHVFSPIKALPSMSYWHMQSAYCMSPTSSHSFWWRSWSQTTVRNTSERSMRLEWLTYWTHLWVWEAN